MSVASKLTKSVRQAKASAANEQDATGSDIPDAQAPEANKATVKPVQETKRPAAGRKPEPEAPVTPLPSRRVWPD